MSIEDLALNGKGITTMVIWNPNTDAAEQRFIMAKERAMTKEREQHSRVETPRPVEPERLPQKVARLVVDDFVLRYPGFAKVA